MPYIQRLLKTGVETNMCVSYMPCKVDHPFRLHEHSLFITGSNSAYNKWRDHVLSYFPVTFDGEWIRFEPLKKPVVHLLTILLRQPIEDGTYAGYETMCVELGEGDPIQELLKAAYKSSNLFFNWTGHGLRYMNMRRENLGIPIENISTEQAVKDLMNSEQMINDAWGNNVRIGFVP